MQVTPYELAKQLGIPSQRIYRLCERKAAQGITRFPETKGNPKSKGKIYIDHDVFLAWVEKDTYLRRFLHGEKVAWHPSYNGPKSIREGLENNTGEGDHSNGKDNGRRKRNTTSKVPQEGS